MNKFQKDLDTIVSGAFSDGMMFQAKGTLTNNDARKLKDQRIKQHLQLFKDTVEKIIPKPPACKDGKQHKMKTYSTDEGYTRYCEICTIYQSYIDGINLANKKFRQNLSKILSEDELEKEINEQF